MEKKTESTVAKTAYGTDLETPVSYSWEWTEYETSDEFIAAKDEMTVEQQMKFKNTQRMAKARSAALTKALDAAGIVKPTAENNTQVAMRDMLRPMLVARLPNGERKFTDEQARALVESTFGEKFED